MNSSGDQSSNVPQQEGEKIARIALAIAIPIVAILGITALGFIIIRVATDQSESAKLVFNAVLPLFGTWEAPSWRTSSLVRISKPQAEA